MFSKLFSIFKRKKKDQAPVQPLGQATTTVPTAGVAVGAGVGAAQPGEAISQTNPVPEAEPINNPGLITPTEPAQDTTLPTEPTSAPETTSPEVVEPVAPAPEESFPVEAPPAPETPSEPAPAPQPAPEDENQNVAL